MAACCSTCARARYSVSESHGRCLLQLWSEERNLMRTVVEVQQRAQCLRLLTRRMGAAKPQALELVPTSDRRTPTARDAARRNYQRLLERVLTRAFIGAKVDGLRSAMDLEHSFGPAYVRGRLLRGTAAEAVIGVSEAESAAMVDGVLTLGILWLDYCREAWRRPAPFWRTESDCAGRRMAHYGRAHGLAQSLRPPIFSFLLSMSAAKNSCRLTFATPEIWIRGWFTLFLGMRRSSAARRASIAY